ncbi:uncharacterized protein MISP3 [Mixophyes fleayi]|uniref:uncharacterized protein MISP3 n=1 Tax=Mixophyes fleayi TaxID=3061075 RepID=UPI003F4DC400
MASEQKLDISDENPCDPSHAIVASQHTGHPPSDCELPNCSTSDTEHKGEPVTHPVTATLGNGGSGEGQLTDGDRTGSEGQGSVTGDLEIGREVQQAGAGSEGQDVLKRNREEEITEEKEVTCEDTPGQETNIEVLSLGETGPRVSGEETGPPVTDEETGPPVSGEETGPRVSGEETGPPVTGEETGPRVSGEETGPPVTGEETGPRVSGEETGPRVLEEETGPPVTDEVTGPRGTAEETGEGQETGPRVMGGETDPQVSGEVTTGPQVTDVVTGPQETGEETGKGQVTNIEVTNMETSPRVMGGETAPQVSVGVTGPQVTDEVTGPRGTGEETGEVVAGEVTDPQETVIETDPQVTSKETSPVEETDTSVTENVDVHVTDESERWIEMLVKNIVTEVTTEGASAGEESAPEGADSQVDIPGEAAGAGVPLIQAGTHSIVLVIDTEITTEEQVTEGAGAAVQGTGGEVNTHVQVSDENTDITVPVSREDTQGREEGVVEVTATPEELSREETGGDDQVNLSCEEANAHIKEAAGAQVCASGEEAEIERAGKLDTGVQGTASGQEAEGKVTPDLLSDTGREGTLDPQRPVACQEKEWPPLICTGSEVRADTAEEAEAQQGTATEVTLCHSTPEMKERQIVQEGETLAPETPIEREIRLALEREKNLRQERGIDVTVGQPELVEVRRKTIMVEPVALTGKERKLAGAQMQRDIQLETRREQDLVKLGKVMGTYDRGHKQELQERKMIFESFTESSDPPMKKNQSEPQQSKFLVASASEFPVAPNYVAPARESKKGPSYAEANGSNVIIIEHSSLLHRAAPGNVSSSAPADPRSSTPAYPRRSAPADSRHSAPADYRRSAPVDSRSFAPVETSRANSVSSPPLDNVDSALPAPGSPFQRLRSPSPRSLLDKEIEEVQEREKELQRQRNSVYGRDDSAVETTQKPVNRSDIQSGIYQPERPSWRRLDVNWPPSTGGVMNGQQQEQVLDGPYTRRQRSALIQSWESGNPNPLDDK